MRKTLIAALFAAALPTMAMAMPPMGEDGPRPMMDGGPRGEHRGPDMFRELDLNKEQRQAIGKIMGEQNHSRKKSPNATWTNCQRPIKRPCTTRSKHNVTPPTARSARSSTPSNKRHSTRNTNKWKLAARNGKSSKRGRQARLKRSNRLFTGNTVIPAQAGIQNEASYIHRAPPNILGPRLRGDDVLLQPTWPNNLVGFVRLPL